MAARLGNVIYWLGWAIAVPAGLAAAFLLYQWARREWGPEYAWWYDRVGKDALLFAGISFGSWLIGRLSRYVLARR